MCLFVYWACVTELWGRCTLCNYHRPVISHTNSVLHSQMQAISSNPLFPRISIFARSILSVSVINVLHNHTPPQSASPLLLQITLAHLPATHPSPLPLQTLHTRNSAKRTLILLHQRFLTLQFVAARRAEDRMLTSCGGVGQGCDVGCCGYGDAISRRDSGSGGEGRERR
jgi:hypothetical protein